MTEIQREDEGIRQARAAGFFTALATQAVIVILVIACLQNASIRTQIAAWLTGGASISTQVVPVADSTGSADPVVSVVAAASPAVVSIVVSRDVPNIERQYREDGLFGYYEYTENGTRELEIAGGSGFLVSVDGYIVTNNHVIDEDGAKYTVFLNDGTTYDAEVIAKDQILDVALLKISADKELPYLSFGASDQVQVGQSVIAIGNALGEYSNTVSTGVVSGLSRTVIAANNVGDAERLQDILQTDAAINPGNSGGPLLDLAGHVIGVNVAASVGTAENIGFALPADAVKSAVDSMKVNGRVLRPWLGARYTLITPDFAAQNNLAVDHGAFILRDDAGGAAIVSGSPADKAALQESDIILEVDGVAINQDHDLAYVVRSKAIGATISLKILRDNEEKMIQVQLEERPQDQR